jgi:hypothetical protein
MSMNNLAFVLKNRAKYQGAEGMHRQVLGLRVRALGKGLPDTLKSMNDLVLVRSDQGKYEQAGEMH